MITYDDLAALLRRHRFTPLGDPMPGATTWRHRSGAVLVTLTEWEAPQVRIEVRDPDGFLRWEAALTDAPAAVVDTVVVSAVVDATSVHRRTC